MSNVQQFTGNYQQKPTPWLVAPLSILGALLLSACDPELANDDSDASEDDQFRVVQVPPSPTGSCLADEIYLADDLCVPKPFTIAIIGDTQELVDTQDPHADVFPAMTEWIVNNAEARNIRFVAHVGDIVQHGDSAQEWASATDSLYLLDGLPELAWSANLGNHDYDDLATGDASSFLANLGPDHFVDRPWFGGSDLGFVAADQSVGEGHNSYQFIDVSGRRFLHLNLEFQGDVEWAQTIIDRYPGVPTIVTTHELLNDQRPGTHPQSSATTAEIVDGSRHLWDSLIRSNSQIFMTFNGHFCCERQLVQVNDAGEEVLHVQANYSVSFKGEIDENDSWLRLVTIDIAAGSVRLSTVAPPTPFDPNTRSNPFPGATDLASAYTWPIDFERRFGEMRRFQTGYRGYAGTHDTWFSPRAFEGEQLGRPQDPYVRTGRWNADGEDINQQALLRFDEIIGDGPDQLDSATQVTAASLNLLPPKDIQWSDGEANAVYPMLVAWAENTASYGAAAWAGGATPSIDTDNLEAGQDPVSDSRLFTDGLGLIPSGTQIAYNVVPIVQTWVDGANNYGFLLQSLGLAEGNALFMASSDYTPGDPAGAPVLRVASTRAFNLRTFRQGQLNEGHVYQSARDTYISPGQGDLSEFHQLRVIDYAGANQQTLVRFDDLIGAAAWQIPADAKVRFAALVLTADGDLWSGTGAVHRAHRMQVDWDDSGTWDGTWGGVGVSVAGGDAAATPDDASDRFLADASPGVFDVTSSVRKWIDGEPNYGWVILQETMGDNRWYMGSSESPVEAVRPALYVQFE
ncbi:putative secreted protein [Enhygromyxa salina]|uniref:Putative secreted protein n=1 Tax=Enhygromyxa salina TaxID=215803 RepID=A0A0C2D089_9BACT|nr:DNRLRE domain-containing protein [Enhygromyxa salina]KIG16651.1 putative secreted protein [Enhygromyxa salina]